MSALAGLGFTAPLMLMALALLPVIWWLLRVTPPRPRRMAFPPLRLLLDIPRREETPSRTPWWLTALRLAAAALLILALAGPVWRPSAAEPAGSGPLVLVIDNGWTTAEDWEARQRTAAEVLAEAARRGRPVVLVPTAAPAPPELAAVEAGRAEERLAAIEPQPWVGERATLAGRIAGAIADGTIGGDAQIVWVADTHAGGGGRVAAETLAEAAPLVIHTSTARPLGLVMADNTPDALTVRVVRAEAAGPASGTVRALDRQSRPLGEVPFSLGASDSETTVKFSLPVELRNDIVRLAIVGHASAGAVQLLDERWRRRTVGLVSGETADRDQPLLSPLHYIERALAPYADIRRPDDEGTAKAVEQLVNQRVSVIVLADVGNMDAATRQRLEAFVEGGGVLIRFAGPRLAAATDDPLVPVRLRHGDRVLGGSLTWETAQPIGTFEADSPFVGLPLPKDVEVKRQVLAEPEPALQDKTWVRLGDGTPLVTAEENGDGLIVLFHVTADTSWSNLPLSGSFVEMLRRIVALSAGQAPAAAGGGATAQAGRGDSRRASTEAVLPPLQLLNGRGEFGNIPAFAEPIAAGEIADARPEARHPPGFYGSEDARAALNVLAPGDRLEPLDLAGLPDSVTVRPLIRASARDLKPPLFAAAAGLFALDALIVLLLAGSLTLARPRRGTPAVLVAALAGLTLAFAAGPVRAQEEGSADHFALEATLATHLAYVITGNEQIDETSRRGLIGLSRVLADRTALEPGDPMGVDPARDELSFFPLLYWPIDAGAPEPSAQTMARVDAFMKGGGTVLFDTRDALQSGAGLGSTVEVTPEAQRLRSMLSSLDIPPLERVPPDHVVTKAFYLLQDFPGRYASGPLWVEALPDPGDEAAMRRPARAGDGVSPIMITGNDFAGAWAIDDNGNPLFPTVPPDERQREYAYRSGVNIVMYTLTGNYKADQVHVPALLERLGQ